VQLTVSQVKLGAHGNQNGFGLKKLCEIQLDWLHGPCAAPRSVG